MGASAEVPVQTSLPALSNATSFARTIHAHFRAVEREIWPSDDKPNDGCS